MKPWEVRQGDCVEEMAKLEAESIDAIVCDPPYELGFMGKSWDSSGVAYQVETWLAALRVLKPGGHLLAFGGTRTYHRLACAIEDAGFEIRDSIAWSHMVSVFCRCDSLPYSHNGHDEMRGVREGVSDVPEAASAGEEPDLQPTMQRQATRARMGSSRGEGSSGMESRSRGVEDGQDDGGEQPGVEGRSDVLAEEGELPRDQVRQSARVGEADGSQGRVHHGASASYGAANRAIAHEDRSSASPRSQSAEQRAGEPGTLAYEWLPSGGGAWPGCPGCGKPLEPPHFGGPLVWKYGSGFPKSLDVSKAIDKRRDDTEDVRKVCRFLRTSIEASSETVITLAERFGFHPRMVEHWAARDTDSQPSLPTLEQWDRLRELLQFDASMDAEVLRLNLRKGEPGEAWADRPVTGQVEEWKDRSNYALTSRDGLRRDVPATPEAQQWQGWGTALKPSHEPIVVARKPLSGTVATNVLEHGTGAINVDGCRIGPNPGYSYPNGPGGNTFTVAGESDGSRNEPVTSQAGRWPANVILSPDSAEELDAQSGEQVSGTAVRRNGQSAAAIWGSGGTDPAPDMGYGDRGGASRFFYCAKASAGERNAGLDGFEKQDGGAYAGGEGMPGRTLVDGEWVQTDLAQRRARANVHPTVKPIDLMRWLVRLVTPPGGIVLDPFTGSGTTGCAAVLEDFNFLGFEREPEYVDIARARIAHWYAQPVQTDLFAEAA